MVIWLSFAMYHNKISSSIAFKPFIIYRTRLNVITYLHLERFIKFKQKKSKILFFISSSFFSPSYVFRVYSLYLSFSHSLSLYTKHRNESIIHCGHNVYARSVGVRQQSFVEIYIKITIRSTSILILLETFMQMPIKCVSQIRQKKM